MTASTRRTRHVERKRRMGPFVKYVGQAAKRTISAAEWRQLGEDFKDAKVGHEWSYANEFMVESAQFSDAQLDYLLIDDGPEHHGRHDFIEVDYDADHDLVASPHNGPVAGA